MWKSGSGDEWEDGAKIGGYRWLCSLFSIGIGRAGRWSKKGSHGNSPKNKLLWIYTSYVTQRTGNNKNCAFWYPPPKKKQSKIFLKHLIISKEILGFGKAQWGGKFLRIKKTLLLEAYCHCVCVWIYHIFSLTYLQVSIYKYIFIIKFPPLNQYQCVPPSVHILSAFWFIYRPLYHTKREISENGQSVIEPELF